MSSLDNYEPFSSALRIAALEQAAETWNTVARYNWIFASQSGWQKLSKPERSALRPTLAKIAKRSGPQTNKLLEDFQ